MEYRGAPLIEPLSRKQAEPTALAADPREAGLTAKRPALAARRSSLVMAIGFAVVVFAVVSFAIVWRGCRLRARRSAGPQLSQGGIDPLSRGRLHRCSSSSSIASWAWPRAKAPIW